VSNGLFAYTFSLLTCQDNVIFPLMEILGIDQHKETKNPNRSWKGVKKFFKVSHLNACV
jgi:hypothetical protein